MSQYEDKYGRLINLLRNDFPSKFEKVQPIKRDEREGREDVEFSFSQFHIDDFRKGMVGIPSVECGIIDDKFWWWYGQKVPVVITEDAVWRFRGDSQKEAEEQAYYALSVLDSQGIVSGWSK